MKRTDARPALFLIIGLIAGLSLMFLLMIILRIPRENLAEDRSDYSFSLLLPRGGSSSSSASLRIFFGNSRRDPDALECSITYSVERRAGGTGNLPQAALQELLKGPTEEEEMRGFFTALPPDVRLLSLEMEDGVATATFDDALERGVGGSCRVLAIRSQITNTLRRFPGIRDVVIAVDDRTEDALQP